MLVVLTTGVAWDGWMIRPQPWSFRAWGTTGEAVVGCLVITIMFPDED
ncbi:MAG: hypothetical protein IPN19_12870 [Elusimicrobia bacterium]|nr:hypothetical protein [Elusimicrobiota bacterium]